MTSSLIGILKIKVYSHPLLSVKYRITRAFIVPSGSSIEISEPLPSPTRTPSASSVYRIDTMSKFSISSSSLIVNVNTLVVLLKVTVVSIAAATSSTSVKIVFKKVIESVVVHCPSETVKTNTPPSSPTLNPGLSGLKIPSVSRVPPTLSNVIVFVSAVVIATR